MNLKDTYNQIAQDWHRDHSHDTWWQVGVDKFLSYLQPGARILDVGCAGGYKAKYLIDKGMAVVGIDISEEFIKIAKLEVPQGEFFVLDMNDVAELNGEFDGIMAQASLLHVTKIHAPQTVKLLTDKLRSGGYLYLAVKEVRPGQADEAIEEENDYGVPYKRFFSYYTEQELIDYCRAAHLEVVSTNVVPVNKTRWLEVMAKK